MKIWVILECSPPESFLLAARKMVYFLFQRAMVEHRDYVSSVDMEFGYLIIVNKVLMKVGSIANGI